MCTHEERLQSTDRGEFSLLTGRYTCEDGETHIGYGFAVSAFPDGTPFFSVEDLSTDRDAVESLIRMMRDADVSPMHYADIIEDFLT